MFWKKRKKENNLEQIKSNLVDMAFNTFLKEGEHYTVAARVNGAILVKKVARWAVCDVVGGNVAAHFSIETDKGVYCFQVIDNKMSMIPSDLALSIYPMLAPEN